MAYYGFFYIPILIVLVFFLTSTILGCIRYRRFRRYGGVVWYRPYGPGGHGQCTVYSHNPAMGTVMTTSTPVYTMPRNSVPVLNPPPTAAPPYPFDEQPSAYESQQLRPPPPPYPGSEKEKATQ